eukprot:TRINITY_DN5923_c0_g1_i1.p1 TRINITY_DN5923_c0_g1~~TRINITY_DN5923_c0_g1_i1.p1  ORF type:complete len:180 (+),score=41.49 TRINITY_DN5923_c0_g1_i1:59-541(+)
MSLDLNRDAVVTGLWCTAALAANIFFIQMGEGKSKFPAGERPPEDEMLSLAKKSKKEGIRQTFGTADNEKTKDAKLKVVRWQRVMQNALQNIPLGLAVAWSSMLTASNNSWFPNFFIGFAVCRWAHTITYVMEKQPHRALAWLGGWICLIGMLVLGIKSA